jgi:hypothetical protein
VDANRSALTLKDNVTQNRDKQDLSLAVGSISSDLEHTQVQAIAAVNADMLFHYWKVGHFILYHQAHAGWGGKVIEHLAKAMRSKYPDRKGYSRRNVFYMCQFAKAYPLPTLQAMAKADCALQQPSVESVINLTQELNLLTIEPPELIEDTDSQNNIIVQ